jgi:hypothetical protein
MHAQRPEALDIQSLHGDSMVKLVIGVLDFNWVRPIYQFLI